MGAGDHVGDDFFVGVAEVRLAVDVVDGGRDVEAFAHLLLILWRTGLQLARGEGESGCLEKSAKSAKSDGRRSQTKA